MDAVGNQERKGATWRVERAKDVAFSSGVVPFSLFFSGCFTGHLSDPPMDLFKFKFVSFAAAPRSLFGCKRFRTNEKKIIITTFFKFTFKLSFYWYKEPPPHNLISSISGS